MNEKMTNAPHWLSAFQLLLAALYDKFHALTLYEWVLVTSLVLSPLAFAASIFFQWRQTRAIVKAARDGVIITKPSLRK